MGSLRLLTGEAGTAVKEAQALMGARRIVEALRPLNEGCPVLVSYRPEEMADWLEGFDWQEAVLAVSGDTGFYSGAAGAGEALPYRFPRPFRPCAGSSGCWREPCWFCCCWVSSSSGSCI